MFHCQETFNKLFLHILISTKKLIYIKIKLAVIVRLIGAIGEIRQ